MALYVDIDDTLVMWDHEPYSTDRFTREWGPNEELITAIQKYLAFHFGCPMFLWSGGGVGYANAWGSRLLDPRDIYFEVVPKYVTIPKAGDICIDDQEIVVGATTVTPEEFIERWL